MDLQDNTYVDPNYKVTKYRRTLDPIIESYDSVHDSMKDLLRKYIIDPSTLQSLSTKVNDAQYDNPNPINALATTLTDNVYPVAEEMITDPINLATFGVGGAISGAKTAMRIPELLNEARYSDLGWKVADKVNDVRLSRYKPVYVPNYSRAGSSGNNIYLAGEDANRHLLGNTKFAMEPVSIDDNSITHSFTNGINSVNNGNHRVMTDRNVGATTIGKSTGEPSTMIDPVTGEKKLVAEFAGQTHVMPLEFMNPNDAGVVAGGSRKVNVRGLEDMNNLTKEQQQAILNDRAKKLAKYNRVTPIEKQMLDMSDGYGYAYDVTPMTQHRFTSPFVGKDAINPFDAMMNYRIVGHKSVNPWHNWIQSKIDDGTVTKVMKDLNIDMPVDMLAYDKQKASQVMDALENNINEDYKNYIFNNKIRLRSK